MKMDWGTSFIPVIVALILLAAMLEKVAPDQAIWVDILALLAIGLAVWEIYRIRG